MDFPKKGIYRHFKGNRYELLDVARHSETLEYMVVYRMLYGDYSMWVRPLSMWSELVEHEGKTVMRFAPEDDLDTTYAAPERIGVGMEEQADVPEQPASTSMLLSTDSSKHRILKRMFGYDTFRDGQEEVIDAILSARDTLAVMPTGAGKSICYQIPAQIFEGVALVVSPLISLMKDQVRALVQNGVPAAYLNSSLTERQMDRALSNLSSGKYKIVYIAPERLMTPRFIAIMQQLTISMVAVDEAHCISQWGQDFRPSYLTIADFIRMLPKRPVILACTATATARVRDDIIQLLMLSNPFVRINGFDRKNLYYSVSTPDSKDAELYRLMALYKGLSGIVYCATRKNVEKLYDALLVKGYSVARYHAGLSDEERIQSQEDFTFDRKKIMVATNAFGMGIDKSNVRFVIHYNMPGDIESYYQEAGRAGRDGERADCHLIFTNQDILTQKFFINKIGEEAGLEGEALQTLKKTAQTRLNAMIRYCQTADCLRKYILEYFGEKHEGNCGFCLNCLSPQATEDMTAIAKAVLSCVEEAGECYGRQLIVNILREAEDERIQRFHLQDLNSYGAARSRSTASIMRTVDRLIEINALRVEELENGQYPILKLGSAAAAILEGRLTVAIAASKKKQREKPLPEEVGANYDSELYKRLKALRSKLAMARGIPAYIIFADSVLKSMAARMPANLEEMGQISGIGVVKLRDYGNIFLKEIGKYRDES